MTDDASDIPGNGVAGPEHDGTAFSEADCDPALADGAGLPEESVDEDGLALRIEEPDDPGTILVAVAEPSDSYYDQLPPCESGAFRAEQAAYAEDVPAEPRLRQQDAALPVYGDLAEIAAVRLNGLGPALFFLTRGLALAPGDKVIVELEDGQVLGETASLLRMNPEHLDVGDGSKIRPVVRAATEKDIQAAEANDTLTAEALDFCRQCIRERNLDMKLVDVLTLHDRGKMIFYFTAPARIDFRELVKDLVRRYRTRIELRQIGVRHETQMIGALGNCGMVCCCRRYLRKFAPVAIKMAKEQNVFLNPVKISGICGRLLCCLSYEQGHYDEFYRSCPKLGKKYHTDAGVMRVLRASLFRESVSVLTEANEELEYSLADWNALNPYRPSAQQHNQGGKKPDAREGVPERSSDDKPRKNSRISLAARHAKGEANPDKPKRHVPSTEAGAAVAEEVRIAVIEDADVVVVSEARSHMEISFEPGGDVDAPVFDDDNGDEDGGGSIFGLAPRRLNDTPKSAVPGDERERPDGPSSRRKRPHRRHGRKKPSQNPE